MKIGISACLLGDNVRYDGKNQRNDKLLELINGHDVVKLCPETYSGMTIPRTPIELQANKAIDRDGNDVTDILNKGVNICLDLALDCDFFILKNKSPSCGYGKIYDGSFSNTITKGYGLFAQALIKQNKKVFNDEDLDKIKAYLNS